MDISGTDTILKNPWPIGAKKSVTTSYLKAKWLNMVMETVEGEDEIFFYEDQNAKDSWNKHGRTEENAEKMVHLIAKSDYITLVHEHLNIKEVESKFSTGNNE